MQISKQAREAWERIIQNPSPFDEDMAATEIQRACEEYAAEKDTEIERLETAAKLTIEALGGTCDAEDCPQCRAYFAACAALGDEPK